MPALQTYITEPIWEQLVALLPKKETDHPLGCHRPRIPDRVVFEKLIQILVFVRPGGGRLRERQAGFAGLDEAMGGGAYERLA